MSHHIYCNTLQHTATHCNTLQHTATHCNPGTAAVLYVWGSDLYGECGVGGGDDEGGEEGEEGGGEGGGSPRLSLSVHGGGRGRSSKLKLYLLPMQNRAVDAHMIEV